MPFIYRSPSPVPPAPAHNPIFPTLNLNFLAIGGMEDAVNQRRAPLASEPRLWICR